MFSSNTSQVSGDAVFIEDVMSTHLYTGNGTSQTITNGIDLSGKGGLAWIKTRNAANAHCLFDTLRGINSPLYTNTTQAQGTFTDTLTAFGSNGFTLGSDGSNVGVNISSQTQVSWTFREQPKFFDVVTYTGNGSNRTIAHNLGSVPGCIVVKKTTGVTDWCVYHRSTGATKFLAINTTAAAGTSAFRWNNTEPTTSVFTVGTDPDVNESGATYVAYLFAHDAGGFGLTGADNVVSCGSYAGTGSTTGFDVNLGYEPQWVLVKRATGGTGNWAIVDNMRGLAVNAPNKGLTPNTADAEYNLNSTYPIIQPTATGFRIQDTINADWNASSSTYIYIAIRRGPMKTPTTGTSVLGLNARSGNGVNTTVTGGAGVTDLAIIKNRGAIQNWVLASRLTGRGYLSSNLTTAETTASTAILNSSPWDVMDGVKVGTGSLLTNDVESTYINYLLDRAPGFMDVVCYSGNSTAGRQVTHNLTVAPELLIVKRRSGGVDSWYCYAQPLGNTFDILLDSTRAASSADNIWVSTSPTATNFTVNSYDAVNGSGFNYVAYLFATCPGVSKVGSYTGTGTTQTISCGFTGGARFVLVKRTNNTGNWTTSDTARGMVAGTNPGLNFNTNAAQSNPDYFITTTGGFQVLGSDPTVNASGGTYIFLAIA